MEKPPKVSPKEAAEFITSARAATSGHPIDKFLARAFKLVRKTARANSRLT